MMKPSKDLDEQIDDIYSPLIDNPTLTLTGVYHKTAKQQLLAIIEQRECEARLDWEELVETRANDVYTYYCKNCNTYWHVNWFKDRRPNGSFNWSYESVYDDFGRRYSLK